MQLVLTFFMSLALVAGLLLVLRRPLRWYLGIDSHLQNQQVIIGLLTALSAGRDDSPTAAADPQKPVKSGRNRRRRRHTGQPDRTADDTVRA